eukprot:UN24646
MENESVKLQYKHLEELRTSVASTRLKDWKDEKEMKQTIKEYHALEEQNSKDKLRLEKLVLSAAKERKKLHEERKQMKEEMEELEKEKGLMKEREEILMKIQAGKGFQEEIERLEKVKKEHATRVKTSEEQQEFFKQKEQELLTASVQMQKERDELLLLKAKIDKLNRLHRHDVKEMESAKQRFKEKEARLKRDVEEWESNETRKEEIEKSKLNFGASKENVRTRELQLAQYKQNLEKEIRDLNEQRTSLKRETKEFNDLRKLVEMEREEFAILQRKLESDKLAYKDEIMDEVKTLESKMRTEKRDLHKQKYSMNGAKWNVILRRRKWKNRNRNMKGN